MSRVSILMLPFLTVIALPLDGVAASLRHDPFQRPDLNRAVESRTSGASATPLDIRLRATVVAGAASVANIDGRLYRLGDEVKGYRVLRITEGSVLLGLGADERRLSLSAGGEE